ncbi:MOSC domain-containing protein [Paludibacterium purpuratum]|uniref:MOSC domain-containing protein YiiM n=1 Tax=Paludibacterium purpuratum TaxID=1144873 RepID=A0A4R7B8B0_9NEIS|nr:MOSC domain-containing protein [Paludibacterium purpuratum]TDR79966.1 MOSC domain-containing protein YiiM [Paludibacterium purpuratum]
MTTACVSIFIGGISRLPESGSLTGMYKALATGPLELGVEGFAGDVQADRRFHGGPEKAVHLYPVGHYETLARQFPEAAASLVAGSLGENLSADLDERQVRIGDIWRLGDTLLQVCQPRNPCWKIDERFACDGMAAYIAQTLKTGWYWRVVRTGRVTPGGTLDLVESNADAHTLYEAMSVWREHRPAVDALLRLAGTPGIASGWRDKIVQRIAFLKTIP